MDPNRKDSRVRLKVGLALLCLGCAVLGIVLAVERPWERRGAGIEGEIATPPNWPVREASLPPDATEVEFRPTEWGEFFSRLNLGERMPGEPIIGEGHAGGYVATFEFGGSPEEAFAHVEQSLAQAGFSRDPEWSSTQGGMRLDTFRGEGYQATLRWFSPQVRQDAAAFHFVVRPLVDL
jgi:hypothetical protein